MASDYDSLTLDLLWSFPETAPKGVVQLVHGMCEYKERYISFMEYLSSQGFICVIHDQRGHGKSIKESGHLGYFYEGGYLAQIEEVKRINEIIHRQYPELKVVLFGHSMGSMVVRSYTKRYNGTIEGVIVCGSPDYNAAATIGAKLAAYYEKWGGALSRPNILHRITFRPLNRGFKREGSPNAWICSDPTVVAAYDADPLCNYQFTANGFRNLFLLMNDCYKERTVSSEHLDLPVHFVAGANDPCIGNQHRFRKAVACFEAFGFSSVTQKLYEGMRHEILNEPDREIVFGEILERIERWVK